ncbi:methylated-DNA/protein-cysteinemethyltransferase [Methanothermus fervidus DSM 2088]|uniref:methylated-DNA--[protein]-cysteine S-methyltransferase n=1 Tax=Methanothermus fervidus (strain ATCC 43054 / DSM 2088 / JCM 10308 / V24 S) TaxID=523846 RepID=E3GYD9_METFV|nr:MGMT family protein [Methanothermus fervidus]ADP77321.1 methylated-DNA/protein-cysteinemethyltransferase [Methanothermus fervidus DSM 2088]
MISLAKYRDKYFAVSTLSGKVVSSSLGRKRPELAIKDLKIIVGNFSEDNSIAIKLGEAYYGKKVKFKILNLTTGFQRKVLEKVSEIPYGHVTTYKDIANSLETKAYRAIGNALSHNPLPIVIPCHRVVRSDHKVGGYRGGTRMKEEILKNEGIKIKNHRILNFKKHYVELCVRQ